MPRSAMLWIGFVLLFAAGITSQQTLFGEENEDLETRNFPDELLEKLTGLSLGAEFVPLSQVRKDFAEANGDDVAFELSRDPVNEDDGNPDRLSLEALLDIKSRDETSERAHPLVPALGKPCPGEGLVVSSVVTHGPLDEHGVRRGDVLTTINGKKLSTLDDLKVALSKKVTKALKVGVAQYDPERKAGLSPTSPQAWSRSTREIVPMSEREVLLAPLTRKPDPIEGNDLYSHRDEITTQVPMVMTLDFFRKVGERPDALYLSIKYAGKTWLFLEQITVKADSKTFTFDVKRKEVTETIHDDGHVSELLVCRANDGKYADLLNAVLTSRKVQVRFSGKDRVDDVEVALSERAKMAELFGIYTKLRK